jgi:hypothetical protein
MNNDLSTISQTPSVGPQMSGTSNAIQVTVSPATEQVSIVATTEVSGAMVNPDGSVTMPSGGGPITFTGSGNLPDGTPVHFLVNGQPDATVPDTTSMGGTFTFTWNAPADTSPTNPIIDSITVSW